MSASHTPGPWYIANGNEVHDKPTRFDKSGARVGETPNRICIVEFPYADSEGQDANAALIASAPALLAALEAIENDGHGPQMPSVHSLKDARRVARSALLAARGGK